MINKIINIKGCNAVLVFKISMIVLLVQWTVKISLNFVFRAAGKNTDQANIRRENKLYSYEEQMAELELKKVTKLIIVVFSMFEFIDAWQVYSESEDVNYSVMQATQGLV